MKIKVIHQWRDWLLKYVGAGNYSFIRRENQIVVRTFFAKNDIDAEKQCQVIINAMKNKSNIVSVASVGVE